LLRLKLDVSGDFLPGDCWFFVVRGYLLPSLDFGEIETTTLLIPSDFIFWTALIYSRSMDFMKSLWFLFSMPFVQFLKEGGYMFPRVKDVCTNGTSIKYSRWSISNSSLIRSISCWFIPSFEDGWRNYLLKISFSLWSWFISILLPPVESLAISIISSKSKIDLLILRPSSIQASARRFELVSREDFKFND